MSANLPDAPRPSFDPPQEPQWHRMIAEAAYYLAQKRGFSAVHCLDDWLAAEQQVRELISPTTNSEATMNDTTREEQPIPVAKAVDANHTTANEDRNGQPKGEQIPPKNQGTSRFEKFAATQAAGDGVEGETLKSGKTVDEKLGANMADRK